MKAYLCARYRGGEIVNYTMTFPTIASLEQILIKLNYMFAQGDLDSGDWPRAIHVEIL